MPEKRENPLVHCHQADECQRKSQTSCITALNNICMLWIYSGTLSDFPDFLSRESEVKSHPLVRTVIPYTCENIPRPSDTA